VNVVSSSANDFIIVYQAASSATFAPNQPPIMLQNWPSAVGPVTLTFETEHRAVGPDVAVPGPIQVEARGGAPTFTDAINAFGNLAAAILDVIAISTNCSVEQVEFRLGYDATRGRDNREFRQTIIPNEAGLPRPNRLVPEEIMPLLRALMRHPEAGRLHRAISQYNGMLLNWAVGRNIVANAHVWMAVEALTKAFWNETKRTKSIDDRGVAVEMDVDIEKYDGFTLDRERNTEITSAVRRKMIFRGDDRCHRSVRKASDAYEHSFEPFGKVNGMASAALPTAAGYLRRAIFDLSGIDTDIAAALLSPPYDVPVAPWPPTIRIRGTMVGAAGGAAPEGLEYPSLEAEATMAAIRKPTDASYETVVDMRITPAFREGIRFDITGVENQGLVVRSARVPQELAAAMDTKDFQEGAQDTTLLPILDSIATKEATTATVNELETDVRE
jgi:hypothetical protein